MVPRTVTAACCGMVTLPSGNSTVGSPAKIAPRPQRLRSGSAAGADSVSGRHHRRAQASPTAEIGLRELGNDRATSGLHPSYLWTGGDSNARPENAPRRRLSRDRPRRGNWKCSKRILDSCLECGPGNALGCNIERQEALVRPWRPPLALDTQCRPASRLSAPRKGAVGHGMQSAVGISRKTKGLE